MLIPIRRLTTSNNKQMTVEKVVQEGVCLCVLEIMVRLLRSRESARSQGLGTQEIFEILNRWVRNLFCLFKTLNPQY